jgi:hypothetical protein
MTAERHPVVAPSYPCAVCSRAGAGFAFSAPRTQAPPVFFCSMRCSEVWMVALLALAQRLPVGGAEAGGIGRAQPVRQRAGRPPLQDSRSSFGEPGRRVRRQRHARGRAVRQQDGARRCWQGLQQRPVDHRVAAQQQHRFTGFGQRVLADEISDTDPRQPTAQAAGRAVAPDLRRGTAQNAGHGRPRFGLSVQGNSLCGGSEASESRRFSPAGGSRLH